MTTEEHIAALPPVIQREMAQLGLVGWRFELCRSEFQLVERNHFVVRHPISGEVMIGYGSNDLATTVNRVWRRVHGSSDGT